MSDEELREELLKTRQNRRTRSEKKPREKGEKKVPKPKADLSNIWDSF